MLQARRNSLQSRLWDTYVVLLRQSNESHKSNLRRHAGQVGNWRRWNRDQAIREQMPIVERIARTESRKFAEHLDIRDLIQAGYVGLMEAARRYKPGNGGFPQFAYFRIRGAIIDSQKRRAYREEQNDSLQAIAAAHDGWLPPSIDTCTALRPDELIEKRQIEERMSAAVKALPPADSKLLRAWMESKPIREQCKISGMSPNYTRDRLAQIQARVRAMVVRG